MLCKAMFLEMLLKTQLVLNFDILMELTYFGTSEMG